jgi:hypothetical protein
MQGCYIIGQVKFDVPHEFQLLHRSPFRHRRSRNASTRHNPNTCSSHEAIWHRQLSIPVRVRNLSSRRSSRQYFQCVGYGFKDVIGILDSREISYPDLAISNFLI